MVNEFELELETCMVMVFNTTKLLRYEKAHPLRSLVSAARVKTRSMVLLHQKFLQFDWLRAVVFQLNLKNLHVKITNLLWVVVQTNNSMICA